MFLKRRSTAQSADAQSTEADLLRRYADGTLPPAERYAVERYLLDHPLHAEALEGTQAMRADGLDPSPAHAELEARLRARLGKEEKRRVIPLWTYGAAAAGLVILLLSTFFWNPSDERSARETVSAPRAEAPVPLAAAPETLKAETPPPAVVLRSPVPPSVLADAAIDSALTEERNVVASRSELRAIPRLDSGEIVRGEGAAATRPLAAVPAPSAAREAPRRPAVQPTYSGQVLDPERQPLPGVTVRVKGTRRGTTTDAQGQFRLDSLQPGERLVATGIGYLTQELIVRDTASGTITLQPDDKALSEVLIVGYGGRRASALRGTKPVGGYPAFQTHLQQARRVPAEAAAKGIHGTVVVRFIVQPDGSLTNLRVTKGLGYGCDEEALRLVREGPRWVPATRRGKPTRQRVRVEVPF
jgi:TonB family protein